MSSLAGLVVTDKDYRIKYVYSGLLWEDIKLEISSIILTIYDSWTAEQIHKEKAGFPVDLKQVDFVANRFPVHRIRHHRFKGGMWWTTELHPPEIGNDSAMEEGLQC